MNKTRRWLVAAFAIMFLVLIAGGGWFYRAQERRLRAGAEENLHAISHLKVAQITQWRAERLADADEILGREFTREVIAHWMVDPQAEDTNRILSWFRLLQIHYQFNDILLVDAGGWPKLSLYGRAGRLKAETLQGLGSAFDARRSVLGDLHIGPSDLTPQVEVIAPLFSGEGEAAKPIGALIQQIDARQFLYPLLNLWPTPSSSAETLLVRSDGDAVLFLNELRFQKGTALKLRIPLSMREVPAVMAVHGREGIADGKDYRGIEVLSVLKAVPGSTWFMVAKVDKKEILADWHFLSRLILVLLMGFVAAIAAAIGMILQHYAKSHYRSMFQSEKALRKSEASYSATLMSIGDGVIATDGRGFVELMNRVAETLTGWRQEEARGKPVTEVFRIVDQQTRRPVEDAVARVVREGIVVNPANNTMLIARDGKEYLIGHNGAPIRSEEGEITGVVLVFRDRTEELAVLNKLRESEERYRDLYDEAPVGYIELDCEGRIEKVNEKAVEMLGYTGGEMLGEYMWNFVVEKKEVKESIQAILSGYSPSGSALERTYRGKNGALIPVIVEERVARDSKARITRIRSTIQEITELKRAKEELMRAKESLESRVRERTAELELRNKELQDFVFIASHDLKEPLRKVQALGDLVLTRSAASMESESIDYLVRMRNAAARMGDLLESLLAYSRVLTEGNPFTRVSIAEAAQTALSNLETRIKETGGSVELGNLPTLEGDHVQLVQLFQNLFGNAFKFCRESQTPLVRVYSGFLQKGERSGSDQHEIYVEDNGIGFDEKYLDKIFIPFQRLHGRIEYEGVGMGLAICRKIVERHNGTITAKSVPGKGSTFIVRLPGEQNTSL